MTADKLYTGVAANHFQQNSLLIPSTDNHCSLASEEKKINDFQAKAKNVTYHKADNFRKQCS